MIDGGTPDRDPAKFKWLRDSLDLGLKLAFSVLREWNPLVEASVGNERGPDFEGRVERQRQLFESLSSAIWGSNALLEDEGAPAGQVRIEVAFIAVCNGFIELAMAWAEANEAVGFLPGRREAREVILRTWGEHVRSGREDPDRFDSDADRLARVVWAYEGRLVASAVLSDHLDDPENPLPDAPGMQSAFAIAAALSSSNRGYGGDVGPTGIEQWLKRFRQNRTRSDQRNDHLWLRLDDESLRVEFVADPIQSLLDRLPKNRGKPRKNSD